MYMYLDAKLAASSIFNFGIFAIWRHLSKVICVHVIKLSNTRHFLKINNMRIYILKKNKLTTTCRLMSCQVYKCITVLTNDFLSKEKNVAIKRLKSYYNVRTKTSIISGTWWKFTYNLKQCICLFRIGLLFEEKNTFCRLVLCLTSRPKIVVNLVAINNEFKIIFKLKSFKITSFLLFHL